MKNNSYLLIAVVAALFMIIYPACSGYGDTGRFDDHIKKETARFFGNDVDWQWFKSQAIVESGMNERAVSSAGAAGIMQLMQGTMVDQVRKLGIKNKPLDPYVSITAGIAYDRRMWSIWKKERGVERLRFMFGSYNAGHANILRAQNIAPCSDKWDCIAQVLSQVTGHHAAETVDYVARIERLMAEGQGAKQRTKGSAL